MEGTGWLAGMVSTGALRSCAGSEEVAVKRSVVARVYFRTEGWVIFMAG